jgi:hypothetical protein
MDSRDTHRNRLVLQREIDKCSLHEQEQINLIWEEEEMSNGARRLGYWMVRARKRRITDARDTLQRRQHSKYPRSAPGAKFFFG